jgi:hypothetical protein
VADAFDPNEWTLNMTDAKNPVLEISVNGKVASLPVSKDVMAIKTNNGYSRTITLEGIVVYALMINQVYIPQQVVQILK